MSEAVEAAGLLHSTGAAVTEYLTEACYDLYCDALQVYQDCVVSENRDPNHFVNPVDKAHQWRGAAILAAKFILTWQGKNFDDQREIDAIVEKMSLDFQKRHTKQYPNFFSRTAD